jgi:hypothetical protein
MIVRNMYKILEIVWADSLSSCELVAQLSYGTEK